MADNKKPVKREGPKYVCPYCKSYYYIGSDAEKCRDRCSLLLEEGKELPKPEDNKLDFSDLIKKIDGKQ